AWITVRTTLVAFVLLGCFLVARYGNEREDFVTSDELAAVQYLYHVAPPQSLLIEGWVGAPWEYQYWDRYTYYSMWGGVEDYQAISPAAVQAEYIPVLMRTIAEQRDGHAYVLFTHNQKAYSTLQSGLPAG